MPVTAPIAVRILKIRALARSNPTTPCNFVLSPADWQCLFSKVNLINPFRNARRPSHGHLPQSPNSEDGAIPSVLGESGGKPFGEDGPNCRTLWRGGTSPKGRHDLR